jgi:UMP-CMP kinase 2
MEYCNIIREIVEYDVVDASQASDSATSSLTTDSKAQLRRLVRIAEEEVAYMLEATHNKQLTCSVYLLEGLDGVGKTTTAAALAAKLGARLLRTPPPELLPFRLFFDGQPERVRRAFYQIGNILVSRVLRTAPPDEIIVLDRYWPSTYAYQRATAEMDHAASREGATEAVVWPPFLVAVPFYLLQLTEEERRARVAAREGTGPGAQPSGIEEARLQADADFRARVTAAYMELPGVTVVNTCKPVEAVMETIASQLYL